MRCRDDERDAVVSANVNAAIQALVPWLEAWKMSHFRGGEVSPFGTFGVGRG
jgi:hypothetical protein